MAKISVAFKFSEAMIEALNELAKPTRLVQLAGGNTKTAWLENVLAHFLRASLKGSVRAGQLAKAKTPDDIFRLWVAYSKGKAEELEIEAHEKHTAKTFEQLVKELPDNILRGLAQTKGLPPAYKAAVLKELGERKNK